MPGFLLPDRFPSELLPADEYRTARRATAAATLCADTKLRPAATILRASFRGRYRGGTQRVRALPTSHAAVPANHRRRRNGNQSGSLALAKLRDADSTPQTRPVLPDCSEFLQTWR